MLLLLSLGIWFPVFQRGRRVKTCFWFFNVGHEPAGCIDRQQNERYIIKIAEGVARRSCK